MKRSWKSVLRIHFVLFLLLAVICLQVCAAGDGEDAVCAHDYSADPLTCSTCGHVRATMSLDTVSLRPSVAGVYFGGTLSYDEEDTDILACGIVVSLENSQPVADGSDTSSMYTTGNLSVLITNVFKEENTAEENIENAKLPIYARGYVKLSDGRYVYSNTVNISLQQLIYTIDTKWETLSATQKTGLYDMCQTYKTAMSNWEVSNMKNYSPAKEALDGKKVVFFGNSHTYYSRCVKDQGQSTTLTKRTNDQGLFYQLCKAKGIEVDVTNYAFGVHQLSDFYSGSCAAGKHDGYDHMADFEDFNYDYVIVQQGTKDPENDLVGDVEKLVAPFKQANPDVKVIFLVHQLAYTRDYAWLEKVALLKDIGVTVVDWGGMLHGILQGTLTVPGTEQTFNQNSFIISQSSSDGYHPNLLVGYITALMTYCTITGEQAEGQPWEFPDNPVIGEAAIQAFRSSYYTYNKDTNFDAILGSETEMLGMQRLIDRYMQ